MQPAERARSVGQGRGEDVRRPQVSARDEPRNLHPSRARLGRCLYQCGDRFVTARGLAKFLQSREPSMLMHLKQAWMHARVHASGDEGLDLQTFLGQECSSSPSPSSPRACQSGQIPHGVLDPREDVAPGELALSQGFVKLPQLGLGRVRRKRRDEARESCIGARVIRCHDGQVLDAKGKAEVVDHGGHQGAAHDATGDEGG